MIRTLSQKSTPWKAPPHIPLELIRDQGYQADLNEDITHFRKIPSEREERIIVSLYKGKGVALERGHYRGLKLLDKVMKVLLRVAENFLRQQVCIYDTKFWHHAWTQHHRRHIACTPVTRKVPCCQQDIAFVDLEKVFDRVSIHVIWWALLKFGVEEWLVRLMKMPEAECMLAVTWVKSSVGCSLRLLPEPPTVHHGSGSPLPRVSYWTSVGKFVCRWPGHHHWFAEGIAREADHLKD